VAAVGLRANNILIYAGPGFLGLGTVPSLLTGMYGLAALRHAYWMTSTSDYSTGWGLATGVVVYNGLLDSFNTSVAIHNLSTDPLATASVMAPETTFMQALGWKQWAGIGLFVTGMFLELYSEQTRKTFKRNPKNKGKIDDTKLWSVVRHPNYLGYLMWRTGITLATGSIGATIGFGLWQLFGFRSSVQDLTHQMAYKYEGQWTAYEKNVPYKMIPGIW